jgi:membrane-associated phospholipid phosphatase
MLADVHPSQWLTRFGEAGIVLPVALALALWLVIATRSPRPASSWLAPLGLAALITTASKVAFLGWGVGIAAIDFTGFSGHAMFAAAIYPMLAHAMTAHRRDEGRRREALLALCVAYAFAALIAASRVRVGAHSVSEAAAGFVLGAIASGSALWLAGHARQRLPALWAGLGLAAWFVVMPLEAAPSQTHGMVTRLALELSGRELPFRREDLHRASGARTPALSCATSASAPPH